MFKSLLNAGNVSIDSLILDIFIILGVVIAGALIFYFLWELVSSLIAKSKKGVSSQELNLNELDKKERPAIEEVSIDEVAQNNDVIVLNEEHFDEDNTEDVDDEKAETEKSDFEEEMSEEDRENAERRAYLEARRQELLRRMQAEAYDEENESEDKAEETEEVEEVEEVEPAVVEENVEEDSTEEVVAEETSEVLEEKKEENVDALAEERAALEDEKARYALMIKELEEAKRALIESQANVEVAEPTVVTQVVNVNASGLSLEELKQKLENAEERLKATEKEFKQCKKEYIPLKRVWETHEKDEKKLRRKEALVAKQKVLLYGVNNYADIDTEKANKLAEDLDLLDGLKLSVQHCEEVMKNNEERYPLLEKMYNVLKLRNDEIKNDIATLKAEIEKMEAESEQN